MKNILTIFYFLICSPLWSQEYMPLEHIGIEEGLSFRNVFSVNKDSEGYMWFCTNDGLNRYDGVNWVIYKHIENDSTSIPSNSIHFMFEDYDGNLIFNIKKEKHEYVFFDKEKNIFKPVDFLLPNTDLKVEIPHGVPYKTKSGSIVTMANIVNSDDAKGSNAQLAMFTYVGEGVFRFSSMMKRTENNQKANIKSEKQWRKINGYYSAIDYDNKLLTIHRFSSFGINEFMPVDELGNFYYPSFDKSDGHVFNSFKLPVQVPIQNWRDFRIDNNWNIWIFEKEGNVYLFDIETNQLTHQGNFELNHFGYRGMFQDEDGTLWLPNKFGVYKLRKKRKFFENYLATTKAQEDGVRGTEIYSITERSDGKLCALSGYNRIHIVDPKDNSKKVFSTDYGFKNGIKQARLLASEVAIIPAKNNQLWVFNMNNVHRYNSNSLDIMSYPIPDDIDEYQSIDQGNKAASFQIDESGKFWFIKNSRLYSFDTLSKKYQVNPENKFMKAMIGIGNNQKWICSNSRLSQFDSNHNILKTYDIPSSVAATKEIEIYKVLPHHDKVWIGTRSGLLVFNPRTEQFRRYTTTDGLSHNIIYTILPNNNYLWMGTHYGLSRFDFESEVFNNFYKHDGLTHNEFNRESALKANNGKLYFGGMNGFNGFYPEEIDSTTRLSPSQVVWTGFSKIDGDVNKIKVTPLEELDTSSPVEIYYGDKSITFHFALLSYLNPTENTYSHYLDGFEVGWQYSGKNSSVNYPILPPGEYVFRVKARDPLGNYSINELAIPIIVYAAWWNTWWARGLFAFTLLLGVLFYNRWQTISLRLQKNKLENTVQERTLALKAQKERAEQSEKYKEQFLANMSHEIRTPMHAITSMIRILERNDHPYSQNSILKAMHLNSENMITILDDILDLSKIEAGKIDVERIPIDPNNVIKSVIQILQLKADERGLALTYKKAHDVPLQVIGDPTRLSQILINLVGNAIKFTKNGSVDISLTVEENQLRYSVQDSGIGISEEKINTIFNAFEQVKDGDSNYGGTGLGLSICKQLIELQNGTLAVESIEGQGSLFYFDLPIIKVEQDSIDQIHLGEYQLIKMAESLKGLNILLAEDNAFNQMIAQDDLSYYIKEVQVDIAENGKIAIEKFKYKKYDLVLMDLQMPEMDGFDACRGIRNWEKTQKTKKSIPIIAMTASLLKSELNNCYSAGMNGYIPKPYKPEELIGRIYHGIFERNQSF